MDLFVEQSGIVLDQASRPVEDVNRAPPVDVEHDRFAHAKVFAELADDLGVRARPREDGLLVVADAENIAMGMRQALNDAVLHWIQVLKLVHQYVVPAAAQLGGRGFVGSQQLLGKSNQIVKIRQVPGAKTLLI